MPGQITKIKKRLHSVNSTKKLTKATELVATVKLQKYNLKTMVNNNYANSLNHFIEVALSAVNVDKETNKIYFNFKQMQNIVKQS